jgi:uncharacterized protein (UPF0332 family)
MTSLETWLQQGWLKRYETSGQELGEQLAATDRDLEDARKDLSNAWRFAIAYTAALRLCGVVLSAAGYRAAREQQHYRTIAVLPLIMGQELQELSTYLNQCRSKRHEVTYEPMTSVSWEEATELIAAAEELRDLVRDWLAREHGEFVS